MACRNQVTGRGPSGCGKHLLAMVGIERSAPSPGVELVTLFGCTSVRTYGIRSMHLLYDEKRPMDDAGEDFRGDLW